MNSRSYRKLWATRALEHAKLRFKQRHGVELTKELHDKIKYQVRTLNRAELLGTSLQHEDKKFYRVFVDGSPMVIVYHRKKRKVLTVYPADVDIESLQMYRHKSSAKG